MRKIKYLSLFSILLLVITGCTNSNSTTNNETKNATYYDNVKIVYFNPTTGKKCNDYIEENSKHLNTTGCLKWYAYSENRDGTVNMMLDHGVTVGINWTTEQTNENGPSSEFLNALKDSTSSWNGVETRNDKYFLDNGQSKYTIDYTGFKARIISAEEIKEINDADYFELQNSRETNRSLRVEGWMLDRISSLCSEVGCENSPIDGSNCVYLDESHNYMYNCTSAYWTSTAYNDCKDEQYCPKIGVYYISGSSGTMCYEEISSVRTTIRPVITIKKSIIK